MSIVLIAMLFATAKIAYSIYRKNRIRAEQAEAARQRRIALLEKEQARLAKEQQKQAEQLAKHEKRIADLEYKMAQAEADIEHWTEQVCNLYGLLDIAEAEQSSAVPGSAKDLKCQKRIVALNNQIHTAEAKINKAKHVRQIAKKELSA